MNQGPSGYELIGILNIASIWSIQYIEHHILCVFSEFLSNFSIHSIHSTKKGCSKGCLNLRVKEKPEGVQRQLYFLRKEFIIVAGQKTRILNP